MAKVEYDRENYNKCICGGCPVISDNQCSLDQGKRLNLEKRELQEKGKMPDPKDMPGLYCAKAVGKSPCGDISEDKTCLCPACPIVIMDDLQNEYYCTRGDADEIG